MKTIKVLGTGCMKCITLENNIKAALEKSGIQASVEKITDIGEIAAYGIMGTPGFVVDEKILSVGKVLEVDEIITLLEGGKTVSDDTKKEESSCCSGERTPCCSEKEEKEETSSCCSEKKASCSCNSEKEDTKDSTCCSSKKEEKASCCSSVKKNESKSGVSCGKNGCSEKIISAIRIALITMVMTAIFTYLHAGTAILWLQNWSIMFAIALVSMCFIIRPFIIQPISKKIGENKGKRIGFLILILIMSGLFTYKFNGFDNNFFVNELKNFGLLLVIAIPLVFLIINPILKLISKK